MHDIVEKAPRTRTNARRGIPRLNGRKTRDQEIHFHEPVGNIMRTDEENPTPPPATTSSLIFCYPCDKFTGHSFQTKKRVVGPSKETLYVELIYKCSQCSNDRVWGTEEPTA